MAKKLVSILVCLSLIVLVMIFGGELPSIVRATTPNSPYTGTGTPIDVFEFARRGRTWQTGYQGTQFNYDDTLFPAGYSGYRLESEITNLRTLTQILPNGQFEQGTSNWALTRNDPLTVGNLVNDWQALDRDYHSVTISANWSADVDAGGIKNVGGTDRVGAGFRTANMFNLTTLPSGARVVYAEVRFYVSSAGGMFHLCNIHPYGGDGQANPETDAGNTMYTRCGVGAGVIYLEENRDLRNTGWKGYYGLGSQAVNDIQAAKNIVNRFTLAWQEKDDETDYAQLDGYQQVNHPTLRIYYEPAEDYVDNNTSNVDGVSDTGTHSNFANEQSRDGVFDTLTEGPGRPVEWWNSSYSYRRRITITTESAPLSASYTVRLEFDHRDFVNAGKSRSDGDDVRILYWTGSGWIQQDRILDPTYRNYWDDEDTRILFQLVVAIPDWSSDNNYYLYYGSPNPGTPPTDESNIFAYYNPLDSMTGIIPFGDDQGSWSILSGQLECSSNGAYSGAYDSNAPDFDNFEALIDVYITNVTPSGGIGLIFREQADHQGYVAKIDPNLDVRQLGWCSSTASWTQFSSDSELSDYSTWYRVRVRMRTWWMGINFRRLTSDYQSTHSYSDYSYRYSTGKFGFWNFDAGIKRYDNLRVRNYVWDRPSVQLGGEERPFIYELSLEIQWTSLDTTALSHELSLYAGSLSSWEDLLLHAWDAAGSTWDQIITAVQTGWNNVSVSKYIDSGSLTLRFTDSNFSDDYYSSSWGIDCAFVVQRYSLGQCLWIDLSDELNSGTVSAYIDNDFTYTTPIAPDLLNVEFDILTDGLVQDENLELRVEVRKGALVLGSWSNSTLNHHSSSWEHIQFTTSSFNGSATLRIAITDYRSSGTMRGKLSFDNITYWVERDATAPQVGLTLNGEPFTDLGVVNIYADPAYREQVSPSNCWSTTQYFDFSAIANVTFSYKYTMYVKTLSSSDATTSFIAPVDGGPNWQINYTAGSAPAAHIAYTFALFLISDWSFTGVEDGNGQPVTEYRVNITTNFVMLDEGVPFSGQDYSIYAESTNHILSIYPQKGPTASGPWTNISGEDYYIEGDYLRVLVLLRDITASSNEANVSIFQPNQVLWQSDASFTFDEVNNKFVSDAWLLTSIDSNNIGSNWTITVSFNNQTECGMKSTLFTVVIETTATDVSGVTGQAFIHGLDLVPVNVTWQETTSGAWITDGSVRIRYLDRNFQVQYVSLSPNGQGAYSTDFSTGLMTPDRQATFHVELLHYGYVNCTYSVGAVEIEINLVNNLNYDMVKPEQQQEPDVWVAQTSTTSGYTCRVRFFDTYMNAYVRNDTSVWANHVRVNFTRYEYSAGSWNLIGSDSFVPDINTDNTTFIKVDASYGDGVEKVRYNVTMHMVDTSWDYKRQDFIIIIEITTWATNLDALRTLVTYPPPGTGDGWAEYETTTDLYEVHIYWGEPFNVTVYYSYSTNGSGVPSATVNIIIGASSGPLTDRDDGHYNYTLDTSSLNIGTTNLFVNATRLDHASQTIRIRLIVERRSTSLTKDYPGTTKILPYNDVFRIRFTFNDTVTPTPTQLTNGTTPWIRVVIDGYVSGYYQVLHDSAWNNATYIVTFFGDVPETEYSITITFSTTYHEQQEQSLFLTIRLIETESGGAAQTFSVPWGDNITISLSFNDTDHSFIGIPGATISFSWQDNLINIDYWIIDHGDGTYTILLNSTKVASGTQSFDITFSFSKAHYVTRQIVVPFEVRDRFTTLYIIARDPSTSVPWGDNLSLLLHFDDGDAGNILILGAAISCNWNATYWHWSFNATEQCYVLVIQTTARLENMQVLEIYASLDHYINGYEITSFLLREILTSHSEDPAAVVSHPWGDDVIIRIDYIDYDHTSYIGLADVTCDWDLGFYSITRPGNNGTYVFTLNTTSKALGSYSLTVTLSKTHYEQQIIIIPIEIRGRLTTLSPQGTFSPTFYGVNTSLITDYLDVDAGFIGIEDVGCLTPSIEWIRFSNGSIVPGSQSLVVGFHFTVSYAPSQGDGAYLLTIYCGVIGLSSDTYMVRVSFAWIGQPYYLTQNVSISGMQVQPLPTNLQFENTEYEVEWNTSVTIRSFYKDAETGIGIAGANLTLTVAGQYYQMITNGTAGWYEKTLDTGLLQVGFKTITVTALLPPNYDEGLSTVVLSIMKVDTLLMIVPSPVVILTIGQLFNISVVYNITASGALVPDATVTYSISSLTGTFTFIVDHYELNLDTSLLGIGSYIIYIDAVAPNFWQQEVTWSFTVQPHRGRFVMDTSLRQVTWSQNINITLQFVNNKTGLPILGATVLFSGALGNGTLQELGNGWYHSMIPSSTVAPGTYYFTIQAQPVQYLATHIELPIQVLPISTILTAYNPAVSVEKGEPVTFNFSLLNTLTMTNITTAQLDFAWIYPYGTVTIIGDIYQLSIDTSDVELGFYEIRVTTTLTNYTTETKTLGLEVHPAFTEIAHFYIEDLYLGQLYYQWNGSTTFTVPKGDVVNIIIHYFLETGDPVRNATAAYEIYTRFGMLIERDPGIYVLSIDTSTLLLGTYRLQIDLFKRDFEPQMLEFSITVVPVPISLVPMTNTSISILVGEPLSIEVYLNDTWHNLGVTAANVTLLQEELFLNYLVLEDLGGGFYRITDLMVNREGSWELTLKAEKAAHEEATLKIFLSVNFSPIVSAIMRYGLWVAIVGIIALAAWLSWVRVFSIPWIVRRMKRMAKNIEKDKSVELAGRDLRRIRDRPNQILEKLLPPLGALGLKPVPVILYQEPEFIERQSGEEDILEMLQRIPLLGEEQKEVLAKQLSKIPARERILFLEELRVQLSKQPTSDNTHIGSTTQPTKPKPFETPITPQPETSPTEPPSSDQYEAKDYGLSDLSTELEKMSWLSKEAREEILKQARWLPPEQRQELLQSLKSRKKKFFVT